MNSEPARAHPRPTEPPVAALGTATLARILDALPTALVVVESSSGRIAYANHRAADVLGAPLAALVGADVGETMAPLEALRDNVEAAELGELRTSIAVPSTDGSPRHLGISLADVALNGDVADATLIVFQDIEAVSRLRDERDRLLKLATVGEVLPSILHELKNPLASVTSAVELLVEEAEPGPQRDDLHSVLTEVRRMKLGFEGIGVISRELRSGSHHAIDLALQNATNVFRARAARDGIALSCEVPTLPLLPVNDVVIRAIAFNLLNNALHACSPGDEVRVSASLVDDGRALELTVEDTGSGMKPETLASCTELFFSTKSSGSGIGLALCKRALESGGGRLDVESTLGSGTKVSACVPLTNEHACLK